MKSEFQEVNPTHSELLRYHLRVTNRVDDEVALKEATKKVNLLSKPVTHQPHQNAQISHDEQKTVVNLNNKEAEKLAKEEKAAIAKDNKKFKEKVADAVAGTEFKMISAEDFEKVKKQAELQVKNAANRKDNFQPALTPVTASSTTPGATVVKPPWEA